LRKIEDGPLISPHRPETAPPSHERVEINLAEPRQDHVSPNSPVAGLPVRENAKAQACSGASRTSPGVRRYRSRDKAVDSSRPVCADIVEKAVKYSF
jgi:hypothetical protein